MSGTTSYPKRFLWALTAALVLAVVFEGWILSHPKLSKRGEATTAMAQFAQVSAPANLYAEEHDNRLPGSMDELIRYAGNKAGEDAAEPCRYFTGQPSGEKFPWLFYGSQESVKSDSTTRTIWMAMPYAVTSENHGPCRSVLYTDLTFRILKEREFQSLLKKQGS